MLSIGILLSPVATLLRKGDIGFMSNHTLPGWVILPLPTEGQSDSVGGAKWLSQFGGHFGKGVKWLEIVKTVLKATRGGLNANIHISCWPPLVALTIFAEPSQLYGPGMYGFSIVISIDSLIIKKDCKRVQTTCWTPPGTLKAPFGPFSNATKLDVKTQFLTDRCYQTLY